MARIVEDSYIQELKKVAETHYWESENGKAQMAECIAEELEKMPEVVRCKDCRYYDPDGDYCGFWGGCRHSEHFCGEGERKDYEVVKKA